MSDDHTLRDDCPDPSCRMGHGDGTRVVLPVAERRSRLAPIIADADRRREDARVRLALSTEHHAIKSGDLSCRARDAHGYALALEAAFYATPIDRRKWASYMLEEANDWHRASRLCWVRALSHLLWALGGHVWWPGSEEG